MSSLNEPLTVKQLIEQLNALPEKCKDWMVATPHPEIGCPDYLYQVDWQEACTDKELIKKTHPCHRLNENLVIIE